MKYKIGDVSQILGISSDLLRYYEKKGVVTPEKDSENNYRYYDSWDLNFLIDCLWFKNFGFSIEQTADIARVGSAAEIDGMLASRESELRSEAGRIALLLRRLDEHRRDLSLIGTLLHRCEIRQCPAFTSYINRVGSDYILDGCAEPALRWLDAMPMNRRYFEFDGAPDECPDGQCRWGYSLSDEYASELGFSPLPDMPHTAPTRCVHTVFKSSGGRDGFSPRLLSYAAAYARENGFALRGRAFGSLLASVNEGGTLFGYFEAWLPVDPRSEAPEH